MSIIDFSPLQATSNRNFLRRFRKYKKIFFNLDYLVDSNFLFTFVAFSGMRGSEKASHFILTTTVITHDRERLS